MVLSSDVIHGNIIRMTKNTKNKKFHEHIYKNHIIQKSMDTPGALIVLCLIIICVLCIMSARSDGNKSAESMAPLNTGTYKNKYPRGRCRRGSFKRSECMVGNCPLGTTVTDDRYCGIQCAQELDKRDRDRCHDYCMGMMEYCH